MSDNDNEVLPGVTLARFRDMQDDLCVYKRGKGWGINTNEISIALADMHGLKGFGRGKQRAYYIPPEALKEAYSMVCGECPTSSDLDTALLRLWGEYHLNWIPSAANIRFDQEVINDDFMKNMMPQVTKLGRALIVVMYNEMVAMLHCPEPEVTKA